MVGLACLELAIGLVAMRRDTVGIRTGRTHRGNRCGVGRHGRCRALIRWCHRNELRGRQHIAERRTNRLRLVRHLVERRPSPGAATLGPTRNPPALRHFHARGGIGCRPGIVPPGDDHMRRQEHLQRGHVRSGDRAGQHRHNQQGSRQQTPRSGRGGKGGRENRHAQSIPSDAIPNPPKDPPDHGPASRAAWRARAWKAKATTSVGPASDRSGSVRR